MERRPLGGPLDGRKDTQMKLLAIFTIGLSAALGAGAQSTAELAACRARTCEAFCVRLGGPPKQIGQCAAACKQTCAGDIPPGSHVTLSVADIKAELFALVDSHLSIDTTMSAPAVYGPPLVSVANPASAQCYAQIDSCKVGPKGDEKQCVANVDKECAGISKNVETSSSYYSYLQFSGTLKSIVSHQTGTTLNDYVFTFAPPHYNKLGGLTLDVNYVHWTAQAKGEDLTDMQVAFSPGFLPGGYSNGPPSLDLTLTSIQSNHPTILVHNSDPAGSVVPDIDINDMSVAVTLKGWKPTADGSAVDYSDADAYFTNSTVVDYIDVSNYVASAVGAKIAGVFAQSSVHQAISSVISSAVRKKLPFSHVKIMRLIGKGDSWLIYYEVLCESEGPHGIPLPECNKAP